MLIFSLLPHLKQEIRQWLGGVPSDAINSVFMFKLTLKPTITKSYVVSATEFIAGEAMMIGTASDIGMDINKLASDIGISYFSGVSKDTSFLYNLYAYTGGNKIYFVTNITQRLGFRIIWLEYI